MTSTTSVLISLPEIHRFRSFASLQQRLKPRLTCTHRKPRQYRCNCSCVQLEVSLGQEGIRDSAQREAQGCLSHRATRLGIAVSSGLAGSSLPARADILDTIQEGSRLIQKDTIISVAFTAAVIALGALTLGVIYLSASSWNDRRIEKAERASFEQALKDREARAQDEKYRPVQKNSKKRRKELMPQGEKKGFGR